MPGVPSGRGCEACRKQKKKVRWSTSSEHETHLYSVTNSNRHALDVAAWKLSALGLVSNATCSKRNVELGVPRATNNRITNKNVVWARKARLSCQHSSTHRAARQLCWLSHLSNIWKRHMTCGITCHGFMEASSKIFLVGWVPTKLLMRLLWLLWAPTRASRYIEALHQLLAPTV